MNKIIYKISLDMSESHSSATLHAFKGETGAREIIISLRDGGKEYIITDGTSAVFRAKKRGGDIVYNNCHIENGKVFVSITTSVLTSVGDIICQIALKNAEGEVIYSPEFKIINYEPVVSDTEVMGTDEFSELKETLDEVKVLKASLERKKGLIASVTTTVESADIVLKTDNMGNALSLIDDFTLYIDAPAVSTVGSIYLYFNSDIGAYVPNGMTKSGGKSRVTMHYNGRTWENYSATSSVFASNSNITSIIRYEVDAEIKEIRVNYGAGFPIGTKVFIYGRVK